MTGKNRIGPLRVISLGAGVQSTTMALMAAHGLITPMPDCAIFADTQDEGAETYVHLEWLKGKLPFPVHTVTRGHLSAALMAGDDQARIPAFVKAGGLSNRQCTRNFKIRPIRRKVRELLGVGPRGGVKPGAVEQWIGISLDEFERVGPSGAAFIVNRHPLIEKRMTREMCAWWLREHGYLLPPKSACVYCAFQAAAQWARRKDNDHAGFAKACQVDRDLRTPENVRRFRGELYLHPSRVPLDQVDFRRPSQQDLFANDCTGSCGV